MFGLWVSGFCTAGAVVNAIESRWAWFGILLTLAALNLVTGRQAIKDGRW